MAEKESFYAQPLWNRLYAFLLAPLLVSAVAVGIFTVISLLTAESTNPDDLVAAIKGGGEHRRWQAAFALTKYLQPTISEQDAGLQRETDEDYREKLARVRILIPEILEVWNDPRRGDDEVRRYLALVFGYIGDARGVSPLAGVLGTSDHELAMNALVGLAMIGDPAAVDAVVEASKRDDSNLRSTAAYVLGVLGTEPAVERLEALVGDLYPSVRWNAAFALARLGNSAGETVILEIMDRGPIYQAVAGNPTRQHEQFLNAVRSAGMLRSASVLERLRKIAQVDENLQARDMAKKLLEAEGSNQ